jgi:hypothetical protein
VAAIPATHSTTYAGTTCGGSAITAWARRHRTSLTPGLFQISGDESGAAGFTETWTCVLREQTDYVRGLLA